MTSLKLGMLAALAWFAAAGAVYAQGGTPRADEKMSTSQLLASAEAGNVEAQYAAAVLLLFNGLPSVSELSQNPAKAEALAVRYLDAASLKNNAPAQYLLGTLYLSGRGVPADVARAQALFLASADGGNTDAQNALGQILRKGQAGKRDDKAAVSWFTKAAEQGNMLALTNLGYMYSHGLGVAKNEEKAIEITSRAAQAGVEEAQHNLGWMYQQGRGVPASSAEAMTWYLRAAERGYAPSALNAGFVYAKGEAGGDVRDQLVEAVKWFALAATSRDEAIRETA
ncbi:MAG: Sel1 domain protein repeat-containing protein, partial [Hyphomicrobiales bacterium]|nr:Sel1 domain protein repeat-containing protein [Hyphomicrobiales bacterium]